MADENYIYLYKDGESGKAGTVIAGKDVVLLDASEVLLSPDTPLLTNAQDVAGAINELFQSGGEGGDDKWVRPSDWPTLGEPAENQIIMLITTQWALGLPSSGFTVYANPSGISGKVLSGSLIVDWGDGEVESIPLNGTFQSIDHNWYNFDGMSPPTWHKGPVLNNGAHVFVIKITFPDDVYFYCATTRGEPLDIHVGKNVNFYSSMGNFKMIEHIKFFDWVPSNDNIFTDSSHSVIDEGYVLRKVETTIPWKIIPQYMFNRCYSLDEFDFSECEEVMNYGFADCTRLSEIKAPKLTTVGNSSFQACYALKNVNSPKLASAAYSAFTNCRNLENIVHADGWTYTANSFSNCYKYYDNPNMNHPGI